MSDVKRFIEAIENGKSVREGLSGDPVDADKVKKLGDQFMSELDKFTEAAYKLVDIWYGMEDAWPDFANLAAEEYPFDKSFDDLLQDIINWNASIKRTIMGK